MSVRALVVDLFGTIVPKWPHEVSVARKRRMACAAGVEERVFRNAWGTTWTDRELGRMSLEESIADVLERVAPPATVETVLGLRDIWMEPVRRHLETTLRPEALATLQRARLTGLKIGLVSNAGPEVPGLVQEGPLAALVDAAVFSSSVGVAKPDRDIYQSVCQALDVLPAECVYVGDGGDQELQGALEVGMRPLLLRIEGEIAQEGLPTGAAAWKGPVIEGFGDLWDQLGDEVRASHDARDDVGG